MTEFYRNCSLHFLAEICKNKGSDDMLITNPSFLDKRKINFLADDLPREP